MPFGKIRKKFTRRKCAYKKRKKIDVKDIEYQESSDEFFSRCFISLAVDNTDEYSAISDDNTDTDSADEYYVILDQPYQYYEHEDIDLIVESIRVCLFSRFKEQSKCIDSSDFICYRKGDLVRFVQLYDGDIVHVKVSVTVSKDFRVTVQVHDRKVAADHEIWSNVPRVCYSTTTLEKILNVVSSYNICIGNPDPELQEFMPVGSFLNRNDGMQRQGYRDCYNGNSTIVSIACCLLVKGKRCRCCQTYRGTLRSLHRRKEKVGDVSTQEQDWLHSCVPNNYLSENQKVHKLKQYNDYTKSLEKKISGLKKKIRRETDSEGVVQTEDDNSDFMKRMEGTFDNENCDKYEIDEQSYKQLFWEQQLKFNKLKDKRQMRWHPILIKWCILLKSKSGSSYDALRKSGFFSLPSERLLYDYKKSKLKTLPVSD